MPTKKTSQPSQPSTSAPDTSRAARTGKMASSSTRKKSRERVRAATVPSAPAPNPQPLKPPAYTMPSAAPRTVQKVIKPPQMSYSEERAFKAAIVRNAAGELIQLLEGITGYPWHEVQYYPPLTDERGDSTLALVEERTISPKVSDEVMVSIRCDKKKWSDHAPNVLRFSTVWKRALSKHADGKYFSVQTAIDAGWQKIARQVASHVVGPMLEAVPQVIALSVMRGEKIKASASFTAAVAGTVRYPPVITRHATYDSSDTQCKISGNLVRAGQENPEGSYQYSSETSIGWDLEWYSGAGQTVNMALKLTQADALAVLAVLADRSLNKDPRALVEVEVAGGYRRLNMSHRVEEWRQFVEKMRLPAEVGSQFDELERLFNEREAEQRKMREVEEDEADAATARTVVVSDPSAPAPIPPATTTPFFWDCECEQNYIHPKAQEMCERCGLQAHEGPDSHLAEVIAAGFTVPDLPDLNNIR